MQEDKIVLVSLLMAELGVHSVAYAFPMVKIITTAVDKSLDDFLHVVPGIGKSSYKLSFRGKNNQNELFCNRCGATAAFKRGNHLILISNDMRLRRD